MLTIVLDVSEENIELDRERQGGMESLKRKANRLGSFEHQRRFDKITGGKG